MRKTLLIIAILSVVLFKPSAHAAACPLATRQAYRVAPSPSVWYVTPECTKKAIRRPFVYFTHFTSWDEVQSTTDAVLNSVPPDDVPWMALGPLYDPQQGAIVKTLNDPKVYFLVGGKRYWIDSERSFNNLGYKWEWVEDVDQALLDLYPEGNEIRSFDGHPPYTLFKETGDSRVYRLEPQPGHRTKFYYRHVATEEVFKSLGYRFDRVLEIAPDSYYNPKKSTHVSEGAPINAPTDAYTINLPHLYRYVPEDVGVTIDSDTYDPVGYTSSGEGSGVYISVLLSPHTNGANNIVQVNVTRYATTDMNYDTFASTYAALSTYAATHGPIPSLNDGTPAIFSWYKGLSDAYYQHLGRVESATQEDGYAALYAELSTLVTDPFLGQTSSRQFVPGKGFIVQGRALTGESQDNPYYMESTFFFDDGAVYALRVTATTDLADKTTPAWKEAQRLVQSFRIQ